MMMVKMMMIIVRKRLTPFHQTIFEWPSKEQESHCNGNDSNGKGDGNHFDLRWLPLTLCLTTTALCVSMKELCLPLVFFSASSLISSSVSRVLFGSARGKRIPLHVLALSFLKEKATTKRWSSPVNTSQGNYTLI